METLRQLLSVPMFAAAVWLVWVVSEGSGMSALVLTCAGLAAVGAGAGALGFAQRARGGRWAHAGFAVAALASVALLLGIALAPPPAAVAVLRPENGVEPFSAARLARLRAEGRPVFVNMTAAWCVTCLVNERVALSPEAVRRAFSDRGIAYLKGDWTRQDPEISAFLRANGRDGVPLYVFFPGKDGPPAILPQILTQGGVLSVIGAAPAG